MDALGGSTFPRGRVVLALGVAVALLACGLGMASRAEAGSASRYWIARPGAGGANGVVRLSLHSRTAATIGVGLRGLPAATSVAVTVRRGTCAAPGLVVAALPGGKTTADGRISKWRGTTAKEATSIATSSSLIVTIRAGSFRRCAALIEQVAATPTPVPTATPTPAPTPTPTPGPSGPPVQVGQRFLSGGVDAFWLRVDRVADGGAKDGTNVVLVDITIEARVDGVTISADDFRLIEPDGTSHGPDGPTSSRWSLITEKGTYHVRGLSYLAPAAGRLDLRYRTLVIHIRN